MPFLGTYMAQLTCFEWKLSHLSPAFCIWHRWRNSRFWAIYFDIRVSASRLLQWPQHPKPQNEVLLPHLWVSLFMAQTWEPCKFISDYIHRKDLKVHPVTKLDMPPTQGKQTVLWFGFSGLGTYDFIIFLRGAAPPGCTTRGSCSHYNGFCSTTYTSMQPLQCGLHPRVAEHQGGTDYVRNGPNRSRTHKIPSIGACSHFTRKNTWFRARLPPQDKPHATVMQPL